MGILKCGCWYSCVCAEKEECAKAVLFLKLADIEASAGLTGGGLWLCLTPYEVYTRGYGRKWKWSKTHMRYIKYSSLEGLMKGVNRIIQRRNVDPTYLAIPPLTRGEFNTNLNGKNGPFRCRPLQEQERP